MQINGQALSLTPNADDYRSPVLGSTDAPVPSFNNDAVAYSRLPQHFQHLSLLPVSPLTDPLHPSLLPDYTFLGTRPGSTSTGGRVRACIRRNQGGEESLRVERNGAEEEQGGGANVAWSRGGMRCHSR